MVQRVSWGQQMNDREISQSRILDDELISTQVAPSAKPRRVARSFPELLIKFREERNFSKAELAKRAGLDPSSITRFEQGQRAPERDSIVQIADAMVLPAMDRDRLLASAGFRSEIWDDPQLVNLTILLNDDSIDQQARSEVRSVLSMATAFLRMQRMKSAE